jgi:hypothetical protein
MISVVSISRKAHLLGILKLLLQVSTRRLALPASIQSLEVAGLVKSKMVILKRRVVDSMLGQTDSLMEVLK